MLLLPNEVSQEDVVNVEVDDAGGVDVGRPCQEVDLPPACFLEELFCASTGELRVKVCDRDDFCPDVHGNLIEVLAVKIYHFGSGRQGLFGSPTQGATFLEIPRQLRAHLCLDHLLEALLDLLVCLLCIKFEPLGKRGC